MDAQKMTQSHLKTNDTHQQLHNNENKMQSKTQTSPPLPQGGELDQRTLSGRLTSDCATT